MTPDMVKWYAIAGLILLPVAGGALYFLGCRWRAGHLGWSWLVLEVVALSYGIALGGKLAQYTMLASPTVKTVGFPFLAAVFELHDCRWEDYVGPLTLPAAAGNFAVGMALPQVLLAAVAWLWLALRQTRSKP